jgi:hypothetical protein
MYGFKSTFKLFVLVCLQTIAELTAQLNEKSFELEVIYLYSLTWEKLY